MNIRKWIEKYEIDCDAKYQSKNTRKTYKNGVREFLEYFSYEIEPKSISNQKIKVWLLQAKTLNTRKHRQCSVNSFYKLTVKMPSKISKIPYPKKQRKLPRVIDSEYVNEVINKTKNLKHKLLFSIAFECALRRGEVLNLKLSNIDRKRKLLLIENAKGGKDRYVPISDGLISLIIKYYRKYLPDVYLFNGKSKKNIRYSASSYNNLVKANFGKEFSTHSMRHSGITAMHESGVDIATLSKHAGHNSIKTTEIYTHISLKSLQNIKSPLMLSTY